MTEIRDDLIHALDPVRFVADCLGFRPDPWQIDALRWQGRRALWLCSRQSGKSTVASLLAVHRAVFYPDSLILLVSPSLRQSSELFRKVADLVARLENRPVLTEDNRLSLTMANGSRVVSLPGSESTVRGFSGASLIIEDEASRVDDDLYRSVRPMLAVSGGRLILMSTPFGKRGHFHQEWTTGGESWNRIEIHGDQCPRISREFLDEERRSLGDLWYRQEYECQFIDPTSQVFDHDAVIGALVDLPPLF